MTDVLTGSAGAISLAVLGAMCFAGAAVLQHGAVSANNDERLSLSGWEKSWVAARSLAGVGA